MTTTDHKPPPSEGDCYEAAGWLVCFEHPPPIGSVLVHGRPTLQRPPFKPYGHAWIEVPGPAGITLVREVANGRDILIPATLYYAIGQIDPSECYRYTRAEARRLCVAHEHWGPWEGIEAEDLQPHTGDATP